MIEKHPSMCSGLLLGALLACTGSLAGCAPKTSSAPAPEVPAAVEKPVAPAVAETPPAPDLSATLQKAAACEDLFSWYGVREQYLAGAARGAEVDAALSAKEAELLAKTPAKAFNDSLEVVAFDWKLAGSGSSEGKKENFNARWLFRKKGPIALPAGDDVQLILRGWPDKAHQHYLEGVGQADNKYVELTFWLKPPLSEIEAGAYFLVERKTYRPLPNVPYRMHTFFSQMKKKEDGSWGYVGRFGELADFGWFAGLDQ